MAGIGTAAAGCCLGRGRHFSVLLLLARQRSVWWRRASPGAVVVWHSRCHGGVPAGRLPCCQPRVGRRGLRRRSTAGGSRRRAGFREDPVSPIQHATEGIVVHVAGRRMPVAIGRVEWAGGGIVIGGGPSRSGRGSAAGRVGAGSRLGAPRIDPAGLSVERAGEGGREQDQRLPLDEAAGLDLAAEAAFGGAVVGLVVGARAEHVVGAVQGLAVDGLVAKALGMEPLAGGASHTALHFPVPTIPGRGSTISTIFGRGRLLERYIGVVGRGGWKPGSLSCVDCGLWSGRLQRRRLECEH